MKTYISTGDNISNHPEIHNTVPCSNKVWGRERDMPMKKEKKKKKEFD